MILSGIEQTLAPDAIAVHAARRPDAIALTMGSRALTYRELDAHANRLARRLRRRGVQAEVPVGICLPRSFDLAVAALGVWRAGGAYVPMDPADPPDRLAFMLRDAQAEIVVADSSIAPRFAGLVSDPVDVNSSEIRQGPDSRPLTTQRPDDLAYLIYTSGSTGEPKGVEVTHANLANLIAWHRETFEISPEDRASHLAGLGFDASVWELWPYLAAGATVCFVDEPTRTSPELLRDWLLERAITLSFVPTPIAERMLTLPWPERTALRVMLTGGDALHHHPDMRLPFDLVNNYGPTECTVVATSGRLTPSAERDALPPIGSEISNTRIFILDERLEPVADGAPGEIYVNGANVARGYHRRPDLTAQKFVPNPFGEGRLYRTGDLGRRLADGQIEFLGRIDEQIMLRGYRIDPLQIVAALNQHPDILDAVIMAREDQPGDKRLVAYLIPRENAAVTDSELREFLRGRLPEHMLPSAFARLDSFPITSNGKVGYTALPAPESASLLRDQVSERPSTTIEREVAAIVAGLLGMAEIGNDENFFLLGGHSLPGAQLIARLRDSFGVEMNLRKLFESPTVSALAAHIDSSATRASAQVQV